MWTKEAMTLARNRFDVDEELESPFNFDNLKKVMVYVVRYKWSMIFALLLSAVGSVVGLTGPLLVQRALDVAIPEKNVPYLVQLALLLTLTIIVTVSYTHLFIQHARIEQDSGSIQNTGAADALCLRTADGGIGNFTAGQVNMVDGTR